MPAIQKTSAAAAVAIAVVICMFIPPALPFALLSLPAMLMASALGRDSLEKTALFFLGIPVSGCLIAYPLSMSGLFTREMWLACWCALCLAWLGLYLKQRNIADDSATKHVNPDSPRHGPTLLIATVITCSPVLLTAALWPYAALVSGHFWSIHDGGAWIAAQGAFPWLHPLDIGHHNDHLFYNPGATFLSASCYLWTDDIVLGESSANLIPIICMFGALMFLMACGRELPGGVWTGAAAFLLFYSPPANLYPCGHMTHDALAPLCVAAHVFYALRTLKKPEMRDWAGLMLSLAMAGMSRAWLVPVFIGAWIIVSIPAMRNGGMLSDSVRAVCRFAIGRRAAGLLILATAAAFSWNIFLYAQYGNPVFPHAAAMFDPPAGLTADEREAVHFASAMNPGYEESGRTASLLGLDGAEQAGGRKLASLLLKGGAVSVFICLMAAVGFAAIKTPGMYWLIAFIAVNMGWLLWPSSRDVSDKMFLPGILAACIPASAGICNLCGRLLGYILKNDGKGGKPSLAGAPAMMTIAIAFAVTPGTDYAAGAISALSSGRNVSGLEGARGMYPDIFTLYEFFAINEGAADRTLVASCSEPGGAALFLLRNGPYWRYNFSESPRFHALHKATSETDLAQILEQSGIAYVLSVWDNPVIFAAYQKRAGEMGGSGEMARMLSKQGKWRYLRPIIDHPERAFFYQYLLARLIQPENSGKR
ncbi:MAG TPA: glycosyltransferase family 39 protein [Candidatus Brocadiia bacterium]|nr:glycosyltransferase family 39 protein [Candidatus Brocadiia bacterium]